MADEKILIGIREAEEKARKAVGQAEKEREEMIKKAQAEAMQFETRETGKHRSALEKEHDKFMKKTAEKKAAIEAEAKKETQKIRKREPNTGKAVAYVSKEFERLLKEGL